MRELNVFLCAWHKCGILLYQNWNSENQRKSEKCGILESHQWKVEFSNRPEIRKWHFQTKVTFCTLFPKRKQNFFKTTTVTMCHVAGKLLFNVNFRLRCPVLVKGSVLRTKQLWTAFCDLCTAGSFFLIVWIWASGDRSICSLKPVSIEKDIGPCDGPLSQTPTRTPEPAPTSSICPVWSPFEGHIGVSWTVFIFQISEKVREKKRN